MRWDGVKPVGFGCYVPTSMGYGWKMNPDLSKFSILVARDFLPAMRPS
jgi:hypothetical protein